MGACNTWSPLFCDPDAVHKNAGLFSARQLFLWLTMPDVTSQHIIGRWLLDNRQHPMLRAHPAVIRSCQTRPLFYRDRLLQRLSHQACAVPWSRFQRNRHISFLESKRLPFGLLPALTLFASCSFPSWKDQAGKCTYGASQLSGTLFSISIGDLVSEPVIICIGL